MNVKQANSLNLFLIFFVSIIMGILSTARPEGGILELTRNFNTSTIFVILGGAIVPFFGSIILAVIYNFISTIIRRKLGKDKQTFSFITVWVFLNLFLLITIGGYYS
ncbi:MAG: hypothetical protein K2X50_00645 [Gammaproteobacteria bacterium]|nr:hypothetical protein [Gammaproteobacteria bacterium]